MDVVRTKTYLKSLKRLRKLGAADGDVLAMEQSVIAEPKSGAVIPGAGGLRKYRFAYGRSGKSGGGRVIYYAWTSGEAVILITTYAKVDKDDLTADEKRLFASIIKEMTSHEADQTGA